jgi:cytoskeletal protein CcmA (bactofilin family)
MKHPFLKKLLSLLEKEVCQDEPAKEPSPSYFFKPFHLDKKSLFPDKPTHIIAKCLKNHETVLSEGVSVKGELHFDKQLRINGCFEGSLNAEGKVIVGPKGMIKGNITLTEAEIHGKVIGDITVSKLTLGASAEVLGNISTESLEILKGAKCQGHLHIDSKSHESATTSQDPITLFDEDPMLRSSG